MLENARLQEVRDAELAGFRKTHDEIAGRLDEAIQENVGLQADIEAEGATQELMAQAIRESSDLVSCLRMELHHTKMQVLMYDLDEGCE